jgi:hypothetical protein
MLPKCQFGVCTLVLGLIVAWASAGCVGDSPCDGTYTQVKQFDFSWTPAMDAETYELLEQADLGEPYVQVGINTTSTQMSLTVPLHMRLNAHYIVQACNGLGCTDHGTVETVGSMAEAIGYVKASNTGAHDQFGRSVALSEDGNTLAVGAERESSSATGIDQADNSSNGAGAVYVFVSRLTSRPRTPARTISLRAAWRYRKTEALWPSERTGKRAEWASGQSTCSAAINKTRGRNRLA